MLDNFARKKVIFTLLGIWFFGTLLVSCAKKETKNINSRGKNIICFGDSITYGVGAKAGGSYPAVLARMMSAPVINAGVDGETTGEALQRLQADVLDRDPLLVVIEFGGNDMLRVVDVETTVRNMKEIVERIHAKGAMAAIVDVSVGPMLEGYRNAFYNIAQEKNVIFIPDIFNGIMLNNRLKSDLLHPNDIGYKIIAQRIYRAITPYLNQNSMIRRFGK
ncbi:MAG TPA: GDSL-type esterase/lipase family protein [Patescibacteria group bacterium]|nr:GDSL-type esterase/lipase family protein [Patescibacteria group bacterium]